MTIEDAIALAAEAHRGQVDKGGEPYILHPIRVLAKLYEIPQYNENIGLAAILHDVVEDSDITMEDLKQKGIDSEALEIIELLTKKEGESYDEYIDNISQNEIATYVKLADLFDNLTEKRIENLSDQQIEKYESTWKKLASVI